MLRESGSPSSSCNRPAARVYPAGPHLRLLKIRPRERLVARAVRLGYSLPDAEDLVQIAYLVLLGRWHRGEPIGDWFGFLAGCIENSGLSTSTRERGRSKLLERQPPAKIEPNPEDRLVARCVVEQVLASLSPDNADLFRLRFLDDMSVPEIAECLNVPEGTVKSRLHWALKKARAVMGIERAS